MWIQFGTWGLRPIWANQVEMSSCCLAVESSGPQKGKGIKLDCMDVIKHKCSMGMGERIEWKQGQDSPQRFEMISEPFANRILSTFSLRALFMLRFGKCTLFSWGYSFWSDTNYFCSFQLFVSYIGKKIAWTFCCCCCFTPNQYISFILTVGILVVMFKPFIIYLFIIKVLLSLSLLWIGSIESNLISSQ